MSYIASTVYHAVSAWSKWKERLRKWDHAAIYWHIAGSNMSNGLILFLFLIILAGYVGVVIVYCGIASHIYNEKHKKARKRVKKYNHNLIQLLKMYEKEKR